MFQGILVFLFSFFIKRKSHTFLSLVWSRASHVLNATIRCVHPDMGVYSLGLFMWPLQRKPRLSNCIHARSARMGFIPCSIVVELLLGHSINAVPKVSEEIRVY